MLEIVDVEERQCEMTLGLAWRIALGVGANDQRVDAMLDHTPGRQARQFVIIGGAEQRVLERLLLGNVGGIRQQYVAFGDSGRPVRGQEYLSGRTGANGLFHDGRAAAAQQFKAGLTAVGQLGRRRSRRGHLQQRCGGIVHQQEIAVLVLNRHAGREQSENFPQDAQFGVIAFVTGLGLGRLKIVFMGTMHGSAVWQSPL